MNSPIENALNWIPSIPLDPAERKINRSAFIRLWTLASTTENYVKADWLAVERQLEFADLI